MELTELKRIETIETTQPKRTVFSNFLALVNRPMFALSVLIHAGLLSLPVPDQAAPVDEETPKEVSALTDLSQVALAQSPLLEQTPLALPSLAPPVTLAPTVKPTVDTSRAPRPRPKSYPHSDRYE